MARSPAVAPIAAPSPFHAVRIDAAQKRLRRIVAAMVAALAVVAAVGGWAYLEVRGALRELRSAGLASLLEVEVRGLSLWIEEKKVDAERWAATPEVRAAGAALLERAAAGEPCAPSAQRALQERIAPFSAAEEVAVFNVLTREGRIASSSYAEYCGRAVAPGFLAELAPVFEGRTTFVRPWPEGERVSLPRGGVNDAPLTWVVTPLRAADGSVAGALGFGRVAATGFGRLLAITAPGTSRDAYAFDESGRMLTRARHEGSEVRDPATGAPTALAAAVAAHEASGGALLEPYRNYRGVDVIGAWRWLPETRLAVALEIEAEEAYGPLRYLQVAFASLFALVLLSMTAAASTSLWAVRLHMREAKRIGPYRIEGVIGEGGTSEVFAATHALLGRPAAVKVLKPQHMTDEAVERFKREAQLSSRLSHPNTVEVFDYGTTPEGRWYYAMERLRGATLQAIVESHGPLPVARAVHLLRRACASLREAHGHGWVHRDVKPGNLMLCVHGGEHDVVKLLDFGIVKQVRDPHTRDLTQYSNILGTPLYMAPERLRDPADADARADIYAIGAVAWFALAGKPAFAAVTDHDIVYRVLNEPAPPLAGAGVPGLPAALEALVAACLEKERERRPADIAEVIAVLDAVAAAFPWTQDEARAWWAVHGAEHAVAPGR